MASVCCNCSAPLQCDQRRTGIFNTLCRYRLPHLRPADILTSLALTHNLTPKQKFICNDCSKKVAGMARAKQHLEETTQHFTGATHHESYLATRKRVIRVTPKRVKKIRLFSPKEFSPRAEHKYARSPTTLKTSPLQTSPVKRTVKQRNKPNAAPIRRQIAVRNINSSLYKTGFVQLFHCSLPARKALYKVVENLARTEFVKFLNPRTNITLRRPATADELIKFSWDTVVAESQQHCPILTSVLTGALTNKSNTKMVRRRQKRTTPIIGTILAIICFVCKPRSTKIFQVMNSIQMWLAGCKRKVFSRFNQLGLCMGMNASLNAVDHLCTNHDKNVELWRANQEHLANLQMQASERRPLVEQNEGDNSVLPGTDEELVMLTDELLEDPHSLKCFDTKKKDDRTLECQDYRSFTLTFDNVNETIRRRHERKDRGTTQLNFVHAYAAQDRIPSLHLSDEVPTADDISSIPLEVFLPSKQDNDSLKEDLVKVAGQIICKHIPQIEHLQDKFSNAPHQFTKESSRKSTIVPLGVLKRDEAQTSEMIQILREYHKYVPRAPNGQPMKTVLWGDGLSTERVNDAQLAVDNICGGDPWSRLEGIEPAAQEWHKRVLLLQDTYDELFDAAGSRDFGTLAEIRNRFNRRKVTKIVKECFDSANELMEFSTAGYTITSALKYMGISSMDEIPLVLPTDEDEKFHLVKETAEKVIDDIFMSSPTGDTLSALSEEDSDDESETEDGDDDVYCICKLRTSEAMVQCSNTRCQRGQWFHFSCVNVTKHTIPKGKASWFCSEECKKTKGKKGLGKHKTTQRKSSMDGTREYSRAILWHGLNHIIRKNAIRENNGPKMLQYWKLDLPKFVQRNHTKYTIFTIKLLSNTNGAASKRIKHQLTWNRTVSTRGGKSNNIACDLHMEHLNNYYKASVRNAGGCRSDKTVRRHSQMIGLGTILDDAFDKQVAERKPQRKKPGQNIDRDIEELVEHLIKYDVWGHTPGRFHQSLPSFTHAPYDEDKLTVLRSRVEKHKRKMSRRRENSITQLHLN